MTSASQVGGIQWLRLARISPSRVPKVIKSFNPANFEKRKAFIGHEFQKVVTTLRRGSALAKVASMKCADVGDSFVESLKTKCHMCGALPRNFGMNRRASSADHFLNGVRTVRVYLCGILDA